MAKKKKATKKTKNRPAKTSSKSKKKPAAKASIKEAGSAKPRSTSVDTLLKKFEKERKTKEAKLAASVKKIEELETKSAKLREQITKLRDESKATQTDIDQLDTRRDQEVAEVLAQLGVQLSASSNSAATPSRPALTLGMSEAERKEAAQADDDS